MSIEDIPVTESMPENFVPCPHCGKPVPQGSEWCPHCGTGNYRSKGDVPKSEKRYSGGLIALMFVLVPFGCCGACIPNQYASIGALGLGLLALVAGLVMLALNMSKPK